MAITERQLAIWTNQGASATSQSTNNSIKNCLETGDWNGEMRFDRYLQGSYKNTTNIYANSDVDVVVELTSAFYSNKQNFSGDAREQYDEFYSIAKFGLEDFKGVLINRLKAYYGHELIEVGEKAIRIKGANGRLDADIVCCSTYRKFKTFSKSNPNNYDSGITFLEKTSRQSVINFPNSHYDNGTTKNSSCNSNFKPATRILKNIKAKIVDNGGFSSKTCPSYFLECLLYNVGTNNYQKSTWNDIILGVLNQLHSFNSNNGLSDLYCQNGVVKLFGNSNTSWNESDARTSINEIIKFWNEY